MHDSEAILNESRIFLKRKINKLVKHHTFRNISYLTLGNVLSQIIALIGAFYIPKLLGPRGYGVYNIVITYVSFFTVFTLSGLTKVIIRQAAKDVSKTKEILEDTIGLRNLFSVFATALCLVVVFFLDYERGTKVYILIYSTSLLFRGAFSSIDAIFLAHQKMKILGTIAVLKQLIKVPLSIVLLYLGYGVLSLIIAHLFIEIISLFYIYVSSKKLIVFNVFSKVKVLKDYVLSGIRFSLLEFLNILSGRIDLIMLSFLTTPENVGIYALAYRLVEKGFIIRTPISQSLFPYYSNKFNNKKPNVRNLIIHTALILIPMIFFLLPAIILIEPVIAKVIGNEFVESAGIFKILVLYFILNFSVIPWGLYLQVTDKEKIVLKLTFFKSILNIGGNIVLFYYFGLLGIAYSTLISVFFVATMQIVISYFYIQRC
ncbi:MAG: oligosaccharide flippase family protein [Candidatus Lokiarchaeota archaeon]|nr:oligosaccharide flippase family protein [Candidatus Lokiarchaeota archaeon]